MILEEKLSLKPAIIRMVWEPKKIRRAVRFASLSTSSSWPTCWPACGGHLRTFWPQPCGLRHFLALPACGEESEVTDSRRVFIVAGCAGYRAMPRKR